jgi:ABC-type nitrate/sulfonate/bicarbonate transport system ATPase subunit
LTEADDPITLTGIYKSYVTPPVYVVRDLSLSIKTGEFFCLIGPSGCGKSTVIKMIAGIEAPTRGTLKRPERVAMVFQSYALLPWLTVESNIAFAAQMAGFDRKKVTAVTRQYMKLVQLERFSNHYPRQLSGGERQRVGLARALLAAPEILLMDEPFSALDPVMVDELHDDLLRIWQLTKKTIVMVSHHFEEAVLMADRIGVMKGGRLEEIVEVRLPRPRPQDNPAFAAEIHQLRTCLTRGDEKHRGKH